EDDKEEQPWHGHQVEHPVFAHLKQETVLPVCRGGGRGVFGLWQKGQLLSFAGCGAWPGTGRPGWRIASLCLHDTADTGRVSSQNTGRCGGARNFEHKKYLFQRSFGSLSWILYTFRYLSDPRYTCQAVGEFYTICIVSGLALRPA